MNTPQPSGVKPAFIRNIHWGLILICSFLPLAQGCNEEVIYPYKKFLDPNYVWGTLTFVYPILLALITWVVLKVTQPRFRFAVSWGIAYSLSLGLVYLISMLMNESDEKYNSLLIVLCGIVFLGLAHSKTKEHLLNLIGFFLTGFCLWLFPLFLIFTHAYYIGTWVYVYASTLILLSYIIEFFRNTEPRKNLE